MLPNIPEVGRPQVLGCAWHFVTCYEYNFATLITIPCWLSVTLPSDYSQLPFLSLQLDMPCPDRRLLVLAQRFVLPSVISMNLSFSAVGVPITKVPCVPEKDNFFARLHYICSEDVRLLRSSFCQYCGFMSRSVQLMHFSTDSVSAVVRLPPAKN